MEYHFLEKTIFYLQQANKYAKTTVAPPPKEIKKVQLPSHFQWFNSNQNDTKQEEQALDVWKRGLVSPFRSYQKVRNMNHEYKYNMYWFSICNYIKRRLIGRKSSQRKKESYYLIRIQKQISIYHLHCLRYK
ncbi:hypothetical protein RMCBS344292_15052 [Rhizopus microsporus]|nr:hypothetical protein RMCBS344292_15052 [Rhizopus microsporus]